MLLRPVPYQLGTHRLGEIVVPDVARYTSEEAEGLLMPLEESLLLLMGQGHHKGELGVAEPDAEELYFNLASGQDHLGLPEIALGVLPRLVGQGNEDTRMSWGRAMLSHILAQVGLLAGETVFFYQPLVDAMGGMPLLGWTRQVLSQPLVDEMDKGTQDGPGPGLSASVTGRAGVPQGLPDRATMMVTLQGDLANTFTFDEVGSSNLFPLVHLEHSYLRLLDFILAYRNRLRWGHFLSSLHPEVGPFQTSIHMEIRVERSIAAAKVIDALEWLGLVRGLPEYIRSDNGPEFVAKAIQQWLKDNHCQTIYIEPGSPWENPYIESFNGKLRAECLDQYSFANGGEAQAITTG